MRISDWSSDVCSSDLRKPGIVLVRELRIDEVRNHVLAGAFLPVTDLGDDRVLQIADGARIDDHLLARLHPSDLRKDRGGPPGDLFRTDLRKIEPEQIGRASCRESVCQYVSIWVVAVSLKTKQILHS